MGVRNCKGDTRWDGAKGSLTFGGWDLFDESRILQHSLMS